jgi:hypothetical protein
VVTLHPTLDPSQTIWRYMSLEELLFMIAKKKLHFEPQCKMKDFFELLLTAAARECIIQQLPTDIGEPHRDTVVRRLDWGGRRTKCISCWHMNKDESLAMWSQYAPKKVIAVRSTVQRLQSSFKDFPPRDVRIKPMTYLSRAEGRYANEEALGNPFIKSKSYEWEKELRALTFDTEGGQPDDSGTAGVSLPIEPSVLIERLFISPETPAWIESVYRETISVRYGLSCPIDKSTMDTLP